MMIMGVDYGLARTGIAICDKNEMLAGNPSVIHEYNKYKLADKIYDIAKNNMVELIVLGFPKNMNDTLGQRAQETLAFKSILEEKTAIEIVLWDERNTTVDAHRILSENGRKGKKRKNTVDAVAATIILQNYLDFRRLNTCEGRK